MAFGFTIEEKDGVHWLKGAVDETAPFDQLLALPHAPLKLNLRGIQTLNSLGLRKMITFAKALGERVVELHDCPAVFIEAVNVMPLVIGGQSKVDRIKSVWLSFHCQGDHEKSVTVPLAKIKHNGTLLAPMLDCPVCKMPMEPDLDSDLDEFFFFLSA